MPDELAIKIERDNAIKRALKAEAERDQYKRDYETFSKYNHAIINEVESAKTKHGARHDETLADFVARLARERHEWEHQCTQARENLDRASGDIDKLQVETAELTAVVGRRIEERDKARAKALEVDGWKQEAEINAGWVKKYSEALRNGTTEFAENVRADELQRDLARLRAEVERWKRAAHEMAIDGGR